MKTIIWDIDDVLNNLMYSWFKEYQHIYDPNFRLSYHDLIWNPPHKILGITLNEYKLSLDNYRNSEKGRNLKPNQQIISWLKKNGAKFRHIAITTRSRLTIPFLAEWVFYHFGDWIRTLSFIPSLRKYENLPVYDKTKGDFIIWLGKADYFIDDSVENIKTAEEIGITSFLFPQPWNNGKLTVKEILEKIYN